MPLFPSLRHGGSVTHCVRVRGLSRTRVPHTGALETSLPQSGGQKAASRLSEGYRLSETPGSAVLASLLLVILGVPGLGDTSVQSPRGLLPALLSSRGVSLPHKVTRHTGFRAPPFRSHLNQLTSAKTVFPNKGPFAGTRGWDFSLSLGDTFEPAASACELWAR